MGGSPSDSEASLLSELGSPPVPQVRQEGVSSRQPPGLLDGEEECGQGQDVAETKAAASFHAGGTCWEDQPSGSQVWCQEEQESTESCRGFSGVCCPEVGLLTPMAGEGSPLLPVLELEDGSHRIGWRPQVDPMEEAEPAFIPVMEGPALGHGGCPPLADESCCSPVEVTADEQECPICTEPYDQGGHRPDLLNCGHVLCGQCVRAIMEAASAADIGRVRCPICRQKTPMMEWEICKLQEELLLLSSIPSPAVAPPAFQPLPTRRPGFWGGLEHHFQVRFHTSRMIGVFPCLRYPNCLIGGLAHLEQRCLWAYRLALLALLGAEALTLLLIFLPIALLLLLFLILEK